MNLELERFAGAPRKAIKSPCSRGGVQLLTPRPSFP